MRKMATMGAENGAQRKPRTRRANAGEENDACLVQRSQTGDADAFATLVGRYRGLAASIACHYLSHYEDAQDVAQEAFVQAYLRLPTLREPEKFAPWLRRATMNLCADRLRKRGLRCLSLDALTDETLTNAGARSHCGSEIFVTRMLVRQILTRLSPPARLTVTLHYLDGYSQEEVAQMLEIPLNTARSRLQAAKRKLREEMNMGHEVNTAKSLVPPDPPAPEFARQIVAEAMRRGKEAMDAYRKQDAAQQYETVLQVLAQWPPDAEQQQLTMQALWQQAKAVDPYRSGYALAIPLFEQALAIARELGDRQGESEKLQHLAQVYFNTNRPEYAPKVGEYLKKAEAIFAALGDLRRQGQCRRFLGDIGLDENLARGRQDYEAALKLFEQADAPQDAAYCRAFLKLLAEVGEARFAQGLIGRFCGVDGLQAQNGWIAHAIEDCRIDWTWSDAPEEQPLRQQRVFWQIGQLHPFFDANVNVGAGWTKPAASYSQQPLTATATVLSDSEILTVPAGTFAACRLIETVTTESNQPDSAPEDVKNGNREEFCGTRRAWYAPGVGIVQLHIAAANGNEATLQLQEYAIKQEPAAHGGSSEYLPLAIGNRWAYGWAGLSSNITAREAYEVTAQLQPHSEAGIWCLEHYAYAFKNDVG